MILNDFHILVEYQLCLWDHEGAFNGNNWNSQVAIFRIRTSHFFWHLLPERRWNHKNHWTKAIATKTLSRTYSRWNIYAGPHW